MTCLMSHLHGQYNKNIRISDKIGLTARDDLRILGGFAPYEEIEANGTTHVLVHAGIRDFAQDRPLDADDESDLCDGRCGCGRRYSPGKILVTGHTPTLNIDPVHEGRIWRGAGHIAHGCLRHDEREGFYVE